MSKSSEAIQEFLERRKFLRENIREATNVLNHISNGYTISISTSGSDVVTPGEIAKVAITETIAEYEKELKHIDSRLEAMVLLASAP